MNFKRKDSSTHKYWKEGMKFMTLAKEFGLEKNTLDFVGHAVALYTTNVY